MDFVLLADDETFKEIEGYEKRYISNYGRVYSKKQSGKFLKTQVCKQWGYEKISFSCDGIKKHIKIHVLVGEAFVGKRTGSLTYDHIDQNKLNNKSTNLRLATKREQLLNQGIRKDNKLGHKFIYSRHEPRWDNHYFEIQIRDENRKIIFNRCLNKKKYTLEDAVELRDDFLNNS